MLDLRWPMGLMFSIVGVLITVYGLFTAGDKVYQRSLGINVNIWWGIVLIIFGSLMLLLAYLANKNKPDGKK
jgi:hypothetical protein